MVGLAAEGPGQQTATGSAAEVARPPLLRAYFELLERVSILEARRSAESLQVRDLAGTAYQTRASDRVFPPDACPERQRLSLSNGVALHRSWREACQAALAELVERDRVLRSFAGELPPTRIDCSPGVLADAAAPHYEIQAFELGSDDGTSPLRFQTAMLFLLPRSPQLPLVFGFGSAQQREAALNKAEREALQRLAFVWGEPLPQAPVSPSPTPEYHHDFYLCPANHVHLRAWLEGRRRSSHRAQARACFDGAGARFLDLTPPALQGKLAVAKAISPSARRLRFGQPAYPPDALPHPVP
jgi:hypothetical protein